MYRLFSSLVALGLLTGSTALLADQQYTVTVTPLQSQEGYQKVRVSKATIGQQEIMLAMSYAINPDCTEVPPGATMSIVEKPTHGTVRIDLDPFFPNFAPENARSACNTKRVPMKRAFYQAEAGYTGHDRAVIQVTMPAGLVRRMTIDIDVR